MLNSHQQNLFCEEQHCHDTQSSFIQSDENFNWDFDFDNEELSALLKKEQECQLYSGLHESPALAKAREEAVEWVLKVSGYYSFSALTAVLAVTYLDRFLYAFRSGRTEKPWMTNLAAVACLSLAAKIDEIRVPLLLDLQVWEVKNPILIHFSLSLLPFVCSFEQ